MPDDSNTPEQDESQHQPAPLTPSAPRKSFLGFLAERAGKPVSEIWDTYKYSDESWRATGAHALWEIYKQTLKMVTLISPIQAAWAYGEYHNLEMNFGGHDIVKAARDGDLNSFMEQISLARDGTTEAIPEKAMQLALIDLEDEAKKKGMYFFVELPENHINARHDQSRLATYQIELPGNAGVVEMTRAPGRNKIAIPDDFTGILKYDSVHIFIKDGAAVGLMKDGKILTQEHPLNQEERAFLNSIEVKHAPERDANGTLKKQPNHKLFSASRGRFNAPTHAPDQSTVPSPGGSLHDPTDSVTATNQAAYSQQSPDQNTPAQSIARQQGPNRSIYR